MQTDNPIVLEQSEQLLESNNANSDECTPLIEKKHFRKDFRDKRQSRRHLHIKRINL